MSVKYFRENFSDGIGFTSIIDPKFKTNTINLKFLTELQEETSPLNAVAAGIIGSSNCRYRNLTELTTKLNALYGTDIGISVSKRGDMQVLAVSISSIDNCYTFDGENITGDVLEIYLDCLFKPCTENGEFGKEPFNFRKKDLMDSIDSEINNKRTYAIIQAQKHIFENEPSAYSSYGSKQIAESITSKQAYKAYEHLLKTAQIEVYYVGPEENAEVKERLKTSLSGIGREFVKYELESFSSAKKNVREVTDKLDINQTKMVMAYKSSCKDIYAIKLMNTILGETPFSKLFANVREKMSLCYYCASGYNEGKGTLIIDSGVENVNVEKAKTEIMNQIEDIRKGNFSDEEMNNSVLSIINSLKGVGDTSSSLVNWYFSRFCRGEIISPDEEIKRIKAVTRKQIIEAAKSFILDTVYVMTGEGE